MPTAATTEEFRRATEAAAPSYRSERLQKLDADSNCPVTARVPMGIHPDILGKAGPVLVDGEGSGPSSDAYLAARCALKGLSETVAQIDDVVQKTMITRAIPNQIVAPGNFLPR
jgi:hypothetical protein